MREQEMGAGNECLPPLPLRASSWKLWLLEVLDLLFDTVDGAFDGDHGA